MRRRRRPWEAEVNWRTRVLARRRPAQGTTALASKFIATPDETDAPREFPSTTAEPFCDLLVSPDVPQGFGKLRIEGLAGCAGLGDVFKAMPRP